MRDAAYNIFLVLFEGFNPAWNELFQFEVYVPELALVRFLIEDHDSTSGNEFIGQYTIPFNSLQMGMYIVPLSSNFKFLIFRKYFILEPKTKKNLMYIL